MALVGRPRTRRIGALCCLVAAALTGASCVQTPSAAEYDAAMAAFDALADEAKAYACTDDYYAVMLGVEGFVIVERCDEGGAEQVSQRRPLSTQFERQELAYARDYYANNPPDSGLLRGADPAVLCGQDDEEVLAGIREWREQTTFPSWDGVEYVPSVEHEVAKLAIWRDVACPLVQR